MILVTGATGFLGSELVKQLIASGQQVRALKRETSAIPAFLLHKHIDWINCDVLDLSLLEQGFKGVDYVYHCAAKISFNPADKEQLMKVNVEGTANVVNLCQEFGIKKLVHVSSVAAVGESKNGSLITEKDFWEFHNRQSFYALSKYQSEMEVWRAIAEGLNAVIINPSVILGKRAGMEGSGRIFETVKNGLRFYTSGSCGFVSVDDVVGIMISLMQSDITAQRFIVSSDNLTYKTLLTEIAIEMGLRPPTIEAKPWMLSLAWRSLRVASIFTGENASMTRNTARSSFLKQEYSNTKVKEALKIDFIPVKRTVKDICEFLKEQ